MFGWFKRKPKPKPQTLTATNQGKIGHCVPVEVRLVETPPTNGQRNARIELVEATSGLPLQFAGHEATSYMFALDDETNQATVKFQLSGLPIKLIPLSEEQNG